MTQQPTVGRIVHYVLPPGSAGGFNVGKVRPMIVTEAWPNGAVNGHVVLDGRNDTGHEDHAYTASYAEPVQGAMLRPGTWHWPPRG